jgi:hypothetical protein
LFRSVIINHLINESDQMKFQLPDVEFKFAGFNFPKFVFTLPKGNFKKRIDHMKNPSCGPYYHKPTINQKESLGFYLDSDGMPKLRWKWCDEVADVTIEHCGFNCDQYGDSLIRGFVMRLPNNRGFLAGASMGEGMSSSVDYYIYSTEKDAAYGADSIAEYQANSMLDED